MQAIILAAGKGTRFRPVTNTIPKVMIPVKGRPLLERIIETLPDHVEEIILIVGYLKEQVREHFGNEWKEKKITYVTQENLDGTGSALHLAKDLVRGKFLVLNGDNLYEESDLERLCMHELGILAEETKDKIIDGLLEDENHRMEALESNAPDHETKLRICGAYVLDERFFRYPLSEIITHGKTEYSLPHTLVKMAKDCEITVERATSWYPIGNPGQLQRAEQMIN